MRPSCSHTASFATYSSATVQQDSLPISPGGQPDIVLPEPSEIEGKQQVAIKRDKSNLRDAGHIEFAVEWTAGFVIDPLQLVQDEAQVVQTHGNHELQCLIVYAPVVCQIAAQNGCSQPAIWKFNRGRFVGVVN